MIKYHHDILQGTPEWYAVRCGKLTASEMKLVLNVPKEETRVKKDGSPYKQREMSFADNDAMRAHVWELLGQRVTQFVEPQYETFDMQRGKEEELDARIAYNSNYDAITDCGFVENNDLGFSIGFSPDGLVGDEGFIEAKSRKQKYQFETYCDDIAQDKMPEEFVLQVQTGFFVTKRKWCDFISYSNGLDMATVRVEPIEKYQAAIAEAATSFENLIAEKLAIYNELQTRKGVRLIKTERKNREAEIHL